MHPKVARALRAARRPYADGGPALGPAYLEPGEMPVEKPDTIYDVAMRYARALRNLGRTAQPGERGMILPIEATETGVKPAVPGIIAQPAEDWKGMVDSGYRPTGEAVGPERDRMAERSFNVSGVVPVAGLAAAAVRPGSSVGSAGGRLFHGSPRRDLERLTPSERGPLGPGVYASTNDTNVAARYSGDGGKVYELPNAKRDVFRGEGHRTDDEWYGFKSDKDRLLAAVEPEKRAQVAPLIEQMWSGDGYPLYARLKQVYGGDEGAQNLFKRAGFEGLSGQVDGPETVLFGPVDLYANSSKASPPGLAALESNRVRGGMGHIGKPRESNAPPLGAQGEGVQSRLSDDTKPAQPATSSNDAWERLYGRGGKFEIKDKPPVAKRGDTFSNRDRLMWELRKIGLAVHGKSNSAKSGSAYFNVDTPNGTLKVRLSDHDLPRHSTGDAADIDVGTDWKAAFNAIKARLEE